MTALLDTYKIKNFFTSLSNIGAKLLAYLVIWIIIFLLTGILLRAFIWALEPILTLFF